MAVHSTKLGYQELAHRYNLSSEQVQQLEQYAQLLVQWNERMNLTALTDEQEILAYHFQDSLEISRFVDFTQMQVVADVGTGAGFPALPLKIMYPHLALVLIEVSSKRIAFLREVIDVLGLQQIDIVDLDWRTFLRKKELSIDCFIARASLAPEELIRIFKPQSLYADAALIYWASAHWQTESDQVAALVRERYTYTVGDKERQYIVFKR